MDGLRLLDRCVYWIHRMPTAAKDAVAFAAALDTFLIIGIPGKFPQLAHDHPLLGSTASLAIPITYFILLFVSYGVRPFLTSLLQRRIIREFDQLHPGRLDDYARLASGTGNAHLEREPYLANLKSCSIVSRKVLKDVSKRSNIQ